MEQLSSFVLGRQLPITLDKPAVIMNRQKDTVSFGELEGRSNQAAHLFRTLGLQPGDHIALFLENNERFHEICWAAHRCGLYYTPLSIHLKASEIEYIVNDCDARLLITSSNQLAQTDKNELDQLSIDLLYVIGKSKSGFLDWDDAIRLMPKGPIPHEIAGSDMIYSSGTTGRPKGIKRNLPDQAFGIPEPIEQRLTEHLGFSCRTNYLVLAPLYHSLPKRHSMLVQALGGTSIVMDKFDAEQALQIIESYQITHCFMVPTMFIRLLKLPEKVRTKYDLSSLQSVVHAAAPCPVAVKQAMLDWLGPIIIELYGNTEECGFTTISSEEWLLHRGSVGRMIAGTIHILNDDGKELPPGEIGTVWIEGCSDFSYHRDPVKTAQSRNENGWRSVGDVGYLNADGYVFLTDRKDFTIITGGINVYPREVEALLQNHVKVEDAAVFGVPDPELGEQVKAVVQLFDHAEASPELAQGLIDYCKVRMSSIKCPRNIAFELQLPYSSTGKLMKRQLREKYLPNEGG